MKRQSTSLSVYTDRVLRHHFRLSDHAPAAERRFHHLREHLAAWEEPHPPAACLVLACTLAYGLVASEPALETLYRSLQDPVRWRDRVIVHWRERDGRQCLRCLSRLQVAAMLQAPLTPYEDARQFLQEWAMQIAIWRDPGTSGLLASMLDDARAWLAVHLPGALADRVIGAWPAADVPLSCLAREQRGKPLVIDAAVDDGAAIQALHAVLLRRPTSTPGDWPELRSAVTRAIGSRIHQAEWTGRRAAIAEIAEIACRARGISEAQQRVIAFPIHLLAKGTPLTSKLAISTCYDYWSVSSDLLLEAGERLPSVTGVDQVVALYITLIEKAHPGVAHKVSACLRAFHDFIGDLLDVPAMFGPVAAAVFEEPPPRANVFWEHEQDLLRQHFAELGESSRLRAQSCSVDELLRTTGRRIGEILTLPICGLRLRQGSICEIAFDPLPSHDRRKSPASTGLVAEFAEPLVATMAWLSRRLKEGAGQRSLLFGAKDETGVWRESATRLTLMSAYKTVTGDPAASLHMHRHSYISFRLLHTSFDAAGERAMNQMTASAGHESASTDLRHYDHLSFLSLADCAEALEQCLTLPSRALGQWLRCDSDALRKAASRASISVQAVGWSRLKHQCAALSAPPVDDRFTFTQVAFLPEPPSEETSLMTTMAVLRHLLSDIPIDQVASMVDLPRERVTRVAHCAIRLNGASAPANHAIERAPGLWIRRSVESLIGTHRFVDMEQPKVRELRRWACQAHSKELAAAASAFRAILRSGYWSLDKPELAVGLLTAVREAGYSASSLHVRFAHRNADSADARTKLENRVRERTRSVYGEELRSHHLSPRRGRPRAYLQIAHSSEKATAARSLSMSGFNALMFAIAVHVALLEEHEE